MVDYWCKWNYTCFRSFAGRYATLHRKSGQRLKTQFTLHSHSSFDLCDCCNLLSSQRLELCMFHLPYFFLTWVWSRQKLIFRKLVLPLDLLYLLLLHYANCLDCKLLLLLLLHEKRSRDRSYGIGRCLQRWHAR